jgi:hypothetical protein
MRVLNGRWSGSGPANMGNDGLRIDAGGRLFEVLTMIGSPGLLLDERRSLGLSSQPPAVGICEAFLVFAALLHQGVLGAHEAALNPGWLIRVQSIKSAH